VFSPYYRRAVRQGRGVPDDHCALNVALYGPGVGRWTMTERGAPQIERRRDAFRIGPSVLCWRGGALTCEIDEVAVPWPRRVRGSVAVRPLASIGARPFVAALDVSGRHRWGPIAPVARVEVDFTAPRLRWRGHGYFDSNDGDEPPAAAIDGWDWQRARLPDGRTAVIYDVRPRSGGGRTEARVIAASFGPDGSALAFEPPPREPLPRSRWALRRHSRSAGPPLLRSTLEDTPFYARSLLETTVLGERVEAVHETLDLRRFEQRWVQALLPFRMPRRAG
jgi:carotenoid 1,2-hydratase